MNFIILVIALGIFALMAYPVYQDMYRAMHGEPHVSNNGFVICYKIVILITAIIAVISWF